MEFGRPVQNLIVQTEPVTRCYGVVPFRCVVGSGQQAISDGNAGFAADASVFNGSFKQDCGVSKLHMLCCAFEANKTQSFLQASDLILREHRILDGNCESLLDVEQCFGLGFGGHSRVLF